MPAYHQRANSVGNHNYNVFFYRELNYDLHFHKNYEIIHVLQGKAVCSVNGKSTVMTEGDFALCLSNEIHSIRSEGEALVWIGVFSEDFIHEFKKYQKGKTGDSFLFRCSEPLLSYLRENFIKDELSDVFLIKAFIFLAFNCSSRPSRSIISSQSISPFLISTSSSDSLPASLTGIVDL